MPHYQHPQRKRNLKPETKLLQLQADWKTEYRETQGLLEEKLLNFIRLSKQLARNIPDRHHLLELFEGIITINLSIFSDSYREKFISPNMNRYCFRFMDQLKPILLAYLTETRIREFSFVFRFKLGDLELDKIMIQSLVE